MSGQENQLIHEIQTIQDETNALLKRLTAHHRGFSLAEEVAEEVAVAQQQSPTPQVPQGVYVACASFQIARSLVTELFDLLVEQHADPQIISYGQVAKATTGFVLLYCRHSVPATFEQKLLHDTDIVSYVTFYTGERGRETRS